MSLVYERYVITYHLEILFGGRFEVTMFGRMHLRHRHRVVRWLRSAENRMRSCVGEGHEVSQEDHRRKPAGSSGPFGANGSPNTWPDLGLTF
jgi:hypothetical protein